MPNYRRFYRAGGCYFFTVVMYRRRPFFAQPAYVDLLRDSFERVRKDHPFIIDAIVILYDHLHCVWVLPDDDDDFSTRWRLIKHNVSERIDTPLTKRGEKLVWQPRFWEHWIRDEVDWRNHVDYVHYNPVKHGYVSRPADWQYSSFRRACEKGWYAPDWGATLPPNIKGMDYE